MNMTSSVNLSMTLQASNSLTFKETKNRFPKIGENSKIVFTNYFCVRFHWKSVSVSVSRSVSTYFI